MPRPYPPEFRERAIALVREGRQAKQTAADLGIHEVTLHSWLRQDDIDNGRRPGRSTSEDAQLRAARGRIRQLEQELKIVKLASKWLAEEERVDPKGAPGDRPSRRCRGTRRDLLPTYGGLSAGLLQIPEASHERHAIAEAVAHRSDS